MLSLLTRPGLRVFARREDPRSVPAVPEASGTVYCAAGPIGQVLAITPNARAVLGDACDRAAELGLTLREVLQPDSAATLDAWLETAWSHTPPQPLALPARGRDAATRWLELTLAGRAGTNGAAAILVEVREVTSRLETERRTRMLATSLEASADAVYIMDADGRIEYVNAAFERVSGYSADDVVGRPSSLLGSGRRRDELFSHMWSALRAGEPFRGELVSRRPDGESYTLDVVVSPVREDDAEPVRYVAVARDITEQKRRESDFEQLAYYDALTGLANYRLLRERSRQILALARRHDSVAALLHVDMVHMRALNDQHGRSTGDQILCAVAERLKQGLRESDTLARVGSDEFLVLLSEVADDESAGRVVQRLHESITEPFRVRDRSITLNARIGIALYPQDAGTFDELLERAEAALRRAEIAHSGFEFFREDVSTATLDRLSLEEDLHWAWENGQFLLHYQPIVGSDGRMVGAEALARGNVVGVEALARWPHLDRGLIPPAEFIPLAERTGRILSLDRWAIATAAKQAASWLKEGWDGWVSVNLSTRTLHDPDLPDYMERTLRAHGLDHGRLVVEITESTAMRDAVLTARVLESLRRIGILIAVDDFGVGHSSLAYLKLFPVDLLKLDASFVRDIGSGGYDEHLVETMISLAHRIGARVVAEGVEEPEQMEWLKQAGCDFIQGYLVGRPAPPEALAQNGVHAV